MIESISLARSKAASIRCSRKVGVHSEGQERMCGLRYIKSRLNEGGSCK